MTSMRDDDEYDTGIDCPLCHRTFSTYSRMSEHLAEISRCVSLGAIAVLVLDGAGWHSSPRLEVPNNIVLLPLPRTLPN